MDIFDQYCVEGRNRIWIAYKGNRIVAWELTEYSIDKHEYDRAEKHYVSDETLLRLKQRSKYKPIKRKGIIQAKLKTHIGNYHGGGYFEGSGKPRTMGHTIQAFKCPVEVEQILARCKNKSDFIVQAIRYYYANYEQTHKKSIDKVRKKERRAVGRLITSAVKRFAR